MPWTEVDSNEYLDWRSRELLELVFRSTWTECAEKLPELQLELESQ
jgi:hypothetical protein